MFECRLVAIGRSGASVETEPLSTARMRPPVTAIFGRPFYRTRAWIHDLARRELLLAGQSRITRFPFPRSRLRHDCQQEQSRYPPMRTAAQASLPSAKYYPSAERRPLGALARDFAGPLGVRVEDKRQRPPRLHDLPSLQKLCSPASAGPLPGLWRWRRSSMTARARRSSPTLVTSTMTTRIAAPPNRRPAAMHTVATRRMESPDLSRAHSPASRIPNRVCRQEVQS